MIRSAGMYGKYTLLLLQRLGFDVEMFCDNDRKKQEEGFLGKKVISETELEKNYRDRFVIIASQDLGAEMYFSLVQNQFPRENIFLPRVGYLYAKVGKQYYDCKKIKPIENEIFVDCGCYDGKHSNMSTTKKKTPHLSVGCID